MRSTFLKWGLKKVGRTRQKAQVARERDAQHGIERSVCELGRMRQRTLQLVRLHSNMKFLMRRERRAYTAPAMEITKEKTGSWCSTP